MITKISVIKGDLLVSHIAASHAFVALVVPRPAGGAQGGPAVTRKTD
ncbi:hypothetical protein [Bifidobacterium commune]|nr:hypothetical protein [Bifidobacterium commune]